MVHKYRFSLITVERYGVGRSPLDCDEIDCHAIKMSAGLPRWQVLAGMVPLRRR